MNCSQPRTTHPQGQTDVAATTARMPQEPRALIAPLLSGLSFLASHGYQRRGAELSISCRFSSPPSSGLILRAYPEGERVLDLQGISFRVEIEGEKHPERVVMLDSSGDARIQGVSSNARVVIKLAAER